MLRPFAAPCCPATVAQMPPSLEHIASPGSHQRAAPDLEAECLPRSPGELAPPVAAKPRAQVWSQISWSRNRALPSPATPGLRSQIYASSFLLAKIGFNFCSQFLTTAAS